MEPKQNIFTPDFEGSLIEILTENFNQNRNNARTFLLMKEKELPLAGRHIIARNIGDWRDAAGPLVRNRRLHKQN